MEFSAGVPIDLIALLQAPEARAPDLAPPPEGTLPTDFAADAACWAAPFAAVLGAQRSLTEAGDPLPRNGKPLPPDATHPGLVRPSISPGLPPSPTGSQPTQTPPTALPASAPGASPLQDLTASANRALAARTSSGAETPRAAAVEPSVGGPDTASGDAAQRARAASVAPRALPRTDTAAAPESAIPPVIVFGEHPVARLEALRGPSRAHAAPVEPTLSEADTLARATRMESARRPAVSVPGPIDTVLEAAAPLVTERSNPPTLGRAVDAATPAVAISPGPQLAAPTSAVGVEPSASQDGASAQQGRLNESVAGQVRYMIDHKLGEAKLNLNPPELGSVEIKISFVEDKAHVHMVAQQSQAREALEQGLPRLRELLSLGGMDLGGASVSGGHGQRSGADSRAAAPADAAPFVEPDVEPAASPSAAVQGRVDLYA